MKGVFKNKLKVCKLFWLLPLMFLGTNSHAQTDTFAIKLIGPDSMTWAVYMPFTDPGAVATRNHDTIVYSISGSVDINHIGDYTISYRIVDNYANVYSVNRYIKVIDTIAPIIMVLGNNPMNMNYCDTYKDPGVKVSDNYDQIILVTQTDTTHAIKLWFDTTELRSKGAFGYVHFTASDQSGNITKATRLVYFVFYTGSSYPCSDVGIDESIHELFPLYLYPNPTKSVVQFTLPHSEDQLDIVVYDLYGKLVYHQITPEIKAHQLIEINVNQLNSGIYFVKATGNNSMYSAQLMLEK